MQKNQLKNGKNDHFRVLPSHIHVYAFVRITMIAVGRLID